MKLTLFVAAALLVVGAALIPNAEAAPPACGAKYKDWAIGICGAPIGDGEACLYGYEGGIVGIHPDCIVGSSA